MYVLIKNTNPEIIIYYQYCPMYNGGKGANWLSKENIIKNILELLTYLRLIIVQIEITF